MVIFTHPIDVCQYFTEIIVQHPPDEELDDIRKAHELVKPLNKLCSSLLHLVVPQLEEELQVEDLAAEYRLPGNTKKYLVGLFIESLHDGHAKTYTVQRQHHSSWLGVLPSLSRLSGASLPSHRSTHIVHHSPTFRLIFPIPPTDALTYKVKAPSMMQRLILIRLPDMSRSPLLNALAFKVPPRANSTLRAPSAAAHLQHVKSDVSRRTGHPRQQDHICVV